MRFGGTAVGPDGRHRLARARRHDLHRIEWQVGVWSRGSKSLRVGEGGWSLFGDVLTRIHAPSACPSRWPITLFGTGLMD